MSADTTEAWDTVDTTAETFACAYCDRPFARGSYLALHYGVEHSEAMDDDERTAYEAALDEEKAALRKFRLKALLALVVVYFGFLALWAVVNLVF